MIGEIVHVGLGADAFVLVTSAFGKTRNIMTMGRHTVMEFTPSLVGCVIAARNHSFELVRRQRRVRDQPADDGADRPSGRRRQCVRRGNR